MSVDKHVSVSPCEVTSKYFASETGMDESLSDFQEKKKITGPKKHIKPTVNKLKSKRPPKRPRGQKDIRTILKKNELVSYTKDFNTVCKQSGIDIDSEQLQLAVALSKSLQPAEDNHTGATQTSSQERTVRIRTTLQEYGFKVPEIKLTNRNKKIKKCKKDYKLLSLTEAEKQQIISDKYSQVLFHNLDHSKCSPNKKKECSNINAKLYYFTTSADYEVIKNNELLYVNNLPLEKTSNKGSLLRDWAEIPGRPVSPKPCKDFTMDISEIECSQDELDVILSGTLKCARNITKDKIKKGPSVHFVMADAEDNNHINLDISIEDIASDRIKTRVVNEAILRTIGDHNSEDLKVDNIQIQFQGCSSKSKSLETARSCSPDLFDDESPSMFNNSEDVKISPEIISVDCQKNSVSIHEMLPNSSEVLSLNNVTKRKSYDIMEMTECIATSVHLPLLRRNTHLSVVEYDATKIKTNDFMDLTECVPNSSYKGSQKASTDENIDLTQNSDGNNDLTIVQEETETVITEKFYENKVESMDLTQSSNSTDDLPFIQVSGTNKTLDETVVLNVSDLSSIKRLPEKVQIEKEVVIINENNDEVLLDLTEATSPKNEHVMNSSSRSSFDEFLYDHSDNGEETNDKSENIYPPQCDEDEKEIDLAQNTSSLEETHEISKNALTNIPKTNVEICNESNLGKIDDISIDYDEVITNMTQNMSNSNRDASNSCDVTDNNEDIQIETSTQSSQECEFEISDKELDYSVHKSRFAQPDINFGGISIMDDITQVQIAESNETDNLNRSANESFLPQVHIKSNNGQLSSSQIKTPCKENDIYDKVKTPSNREYLIKTDEVTPMSDFASMSTPERNQELDKYGLKPLKRKRAIQLLTHIYNQTHPIVETCSNEEMQSPSKKQKRGPTSSKSPKKQSQSPRKLNVSPRKKPRPEKLDSVKENIYEVTNDIVDVKDIECSADDWVFQKREKAKVHSCRVPLHIAFHNYVSCRRWLREAILRYEPVNIDVIHKDLAANGFKYDPKDLLKFLDKKCITVKTTDNSSRNNRR